MSTTISNIIDIMSVKTEKQQSGLSDSVKHSLQQYLKDLDGDHPDNLYDMVLQQVEQPLFKMVMDYVGGNQSRAAECLGINRGTLRKKLKQYDLI